MKKELEMNTEKYMRAVMRVKEMVEEYGELNGKAQAVTFRIKSPESIADKLKKKGYEVTFENAQQYLSDLAGVRVICISEEEIYALEQYLCERDNIRVLKRKDYIKTPKENGYKSLHLILELSGISAYANIRVELQIRTKEMHRWAQIDHERFYKKLTN